MRNGSEGMDGGTQKRWWMAEQEANGWQQRDGRRKDR